MGQFWTPIKAKGGSLLHAVLQPYLGLILKAFSNHCDLFSRDPTPDPQTVPKGENVAPQVQLDLNPFQYLEHPHLYL
jgi:hypothetical protein